jgi:integrase
MRSGLQTRCDRAGFPLPAPLTCCMDVASSKSICNDVPNASLSRAVFALSVHPYKTKDGQRYRTCWRENGRPRSRSFIRRKEANDFDIEIKARRLRGEVIPRTSRNTLAEAYEEWRRLYAKQRLSKKTLTRYAEAWDPHIKGRHDHYTLAQLVAEPQLFEEMLDEMRERGVGDETQRKVMIVMSSVFKAAKRWKKVSENPVREVPKPRAARKRTPSPLPPMVVERIRLQMRRRKTRDPSGARAIADACLVTLMAYAGLRPGEALALTWGDIKPKMLNIDKAVSVGEDDDNEEADTKTGGVRFPPLVEQLAADLADLRAARGETTDADLVFPASDGGYWSPSQYGNWRRRVWKPILKKLAEGKPPQPQLMKARPYDCRGSFVSLHLRAGENAVEVAEWGGHSPRVMFTYYAGVIKELRGEPTLPAAEQIARARDAVIEREREELDELMADLIEHPTITSVRMVRGRRDRTRAAITFYAPNI